jgi:hypothetical protein
MFIKNGVIFFDSLHVRRTSLPPVTKPVKLELMQAVEHYEAAA